MKNLVRITMLAFLLPLMTFIQSCQKDELVNKRGESSVSGSSELKSQGSNTFYGPSVPLGNGVARAWIKVDGNGNGDPVAVGIELSEKALENLPEVSTSFVLDFPKNKGGNFYNHMLVDWNPHGHLPFYGAPHFDFHFYWISVEERLAIGPENSPLFDVMPAEMYIPENYMKVPGGVPQMGAHWVDLMAPEFTGGEFTRTMIWGSYDGEFIFVEPMITTEFLLTHPDEVISMSQPDAVQVSGWYPMQYSVVYSENPGKYRVSLLDLNWHTGE